MKKMFALMALLSVCVSASQPAALHTVQTLESIEKAAGAAALASFFLLSTFPEDFCSDSVIATYFFSQLVHIAANVALLKHKKNKLAFVRAALPVVVLFSIFKMTVDLHESKPQLNPVDALQTNLSKIGEDYADPFNSFLALICTTGVLGQFSILCYDCASADN